MDPYVVLQSNVIRGPDNFDVARGGHMFFQSLISVISVLFCSCLERMGEKKSVYRLLVGKPERKTTIRKTKT
jgi:hypothetical protein